MNVVNTVDLSAFGLNDRHLTLNDISISKIVNLQSILDNKVEAEEGSRLINAEEIEKLKNFTDLVKSVNPVEFTVSESGELNLNAIEIQKVAGLQAILDEKVTAEEGKGLSTNDYTDTDKSSVALIPGLKATVSNLDILINGQEDPETGDVLVSGMIDEVANLKMVTSNLDKKFSDYVTHTIFNNTITNINSDIQDLDYRLQWQEIL